MSKFFKKVLLWVILIALFLGVVVFINSRIDQEKKEKSENNLHQNAPEPLDDDKPEDNPEPAPTDTENWWLTDEEIEYAYQEISKEITNSPEIQLVNPSIVRVIQEGGEISEDLKKAKYIFFPVNNSENHETGDSGSHWTLLVYAGGELGVFFNYNSLEFSVTPKNAMKVAENFHKKANLTTLLSVENVKELPCQTNGADCGVYVIAYTRALIKKISGKASRRRNRYKFRWKKISFPNCRRKTKIKSGGFS